MANPLSKIEFKAADGRVTSLAEHAGKVVLVVNVASKCGLTPQYAALEKIYEKYRNNGFVILGFPANEFAGQEPGTNEQIQEFCQVNYGVQFPIAQKIVVKGEGQHPLYRELTTKIPTATQKPGSGFLKALADKGLASKPGEISWNFEKFLIGRRGSALGRFAPDIAPDDALLTTAIERELAYAD